MFEIVQNSEKNFIISCIKINFITVSPNNLENEHLVCMYSLTFWKITKQIATNTFQAKKIVNTTYDTGGKKRIEKNAVC